jgi:rhodanese-related sulfurtransferase
MELLPFLAKNWPVALVTVVSGLMLLWPALRRLASPVREVGTLDATRLMNHENALLLDVREDQEVEAGRLPNAVHIPLSQLAGRAGELAKSTKRPVIVYCERGQRGASAAGLLGKTGFERVYLLRGGFRAWRDAGLPVQKAAVQKVSVQKA